ncbi:excalibur calcium-binding domain-containing protein [Streptomyces sp. NPDC049916]|uniref:excalibur calcium-binding domain-containing protein n=1 Tax=Streptomyces sp. NPDC049916 TaxID=3155156 RepID=UPI00344284A8
MQTTKQVRRPRHLLLRIPVGAAVLALVLAGCGSDGGGAGDGGGGAKGAAEVVASASASPAGKRERALALMDDDEQRADAGEDLAVDVLDNDSVTLESGDAAALLDAYDPDELALSITTAPGHGEATVVGASVTYTAAAGYGGADEFTYRVQVPGTEVPAADAVVRIEVTAPKPSPKPTPKPTAPKSAPEPVSYENCDAVRAAGAAPIRSGDPGYGRHLDRDGDGVGCE